MSADSRVMNVGVGFAGSLTAAHEINGPRWSKKRAPGGGAARVCGRALPGTIFPTLAVSRAEWREVNPMLPVTKGGRVTKGCEACACERSHGTPTFFPVAEGRRLLGCSRWVQYPGARERKTGPAGNWREP